MILARIPSLVQSQRRRSYLLPSCCLDLSWLSYPEFCKEEIHRKRCKTSDSPHLSHRTSKLRLKFESWMRHKSWGHLKFLCKSMWLTSFSFTVTNNRSYSNTEVLQCVTPIIACRILGFFAFCCNILFQNPLTKHKSYCMKFICIVNCYSFTKSYTDSYHAKVWPRTEVFCTPWDSFLYKRTGYVGKQAI